MPGFSLNDARLNDSFVLSPNSKDFDPTPVKQKTARPDRESENNQNENNKPLQSAQSIETLTLKPTDAQPKKTSPKNYRPILLKEKSAIQPQANFQPIRQNIFTKNPCPKIVEADKVFGHSRSSSHSPKGSDQEVTKQATKSDEYFRSLQRPKVFRGSDQSSKKLLKPDAVALRAFNSEPIKAVEVDLLKIVQW